MLTFEDVRNRYFYCKFQGERDDLFPHRSITPRELKNIIEQIGKYSPESVLFRNESEYARGIRRIVYELRRNHPNATLSHRMVRRLIRPNFRKTLIYKVPYHTYEILVKIVSLIEQGDTGLREYCAYNVREKCRETGHTTIAYKDLLIGDLCAALGYLLPRIIANRGEGAKIVQKIDGFTDLCRI